MASTDFDDRLKWKLLTAGSALVATMIVQGALKGGWKYAWGEDPPENPGDPQVTWGMALGWAAASAAGIALARLLALRGTAAGWKAVKGTTPPFKH